MSSQSDVGNTKLRHAAVTIFGHPISIIKELSEKPEIAYIIGQEEVCPETKREHIQCYVQFTRQVKWNKAKILLPAGSHIEKARASAEENRQYCSKLDSRKADCSPVEFGEIRSQGKRKDLETFKAKCDEGKTEQEIAADSDTFGVWAKYPNLYKRYKGVKIKPRDRSRAPEITMFVGPPGVGKTRRVFDEHKDDVYMKDNTKWWDGYYGQACILLDDLGVTEHWRIEELLRLLDRYPYQGQTKGGYVNINSPFIVITSNVDVDVLYHNASEDQINALNRRIVNKVNL